MTHEAQQGLDLITLYRSVIDADLAAITTARPAEVSTELLGLVRDPHHVLAAMDGEYVIGGVDELHPELVNKLNVGRNEPIQVYTPSVVSGIGFGLRFGPSHRMYVRLDSDQEPTTPPIKALLGDGYVVLGPRYNLVASALFQK